MFPFAVKDPSQQAARKKLAAAQRVGWAEMKVGRRVLRGFHCAAGITSAGITSQYDQPTFDSYCYSLGSRRRSQF